MRSSRMQNLRFPSALSAPAIVAGSVAAPAAVSVRGDGQATAAESSPAARVDERLVESERCGQRITTLAP